MLKIILLHSDSVENEKAKSPSNLLNGEIAINYSQGYETIFISNSSNKIVEFNKLSDSNDIYDNVLAHIEDLNNPHNTSKSDIGLGLVDNTNDLEKIVSNALQISLDAKMGIEQIFNEGDPTGVDNLDKVPTSAAVGYIINQTLSLYGGNWEENLNDIEKRLIALENVLINA